MHGAATFVFKTESNKLNDETTEVMVVGSRSRAIVSDSGYLVSGSKGSGSFFKFKSYHV